MYVGQKSGLLNTAKRIFPGPVDGMLRCELDDSPSAIPHSPRFLNRLARREIELPAHEVLHHPAFFAAYPEAALLPVRFDPTTTNCEIELDEGRPQHITLGITQDVRYTSESTPSNPHRDMLHELQHIVQCTEGFHPGVSLVHEEVLARKVRLQRLTLLMNDDPVHDTPLYKLFDGIRTGTSPMEAAIHRRASTRYYFAAGELEARDTEERLHMSEQQRLKTPSVLENLAQLPVRTILRNNKVPTYRLTRQATTALAAHIAPARAYDK